MSLGLLTRAWSGWRSVTGIGDHGIVWVALCHWDCQAGRRLGGAVSLGLLTRAWSGWGRVIKLGLVTRASRGRRRVIGIADQSVV